MADKKSKKTKKGKASSASIEKKEEAPSGLQMLSSKLKSKTAK